MNPKTLLRLPGFPFFICTPFILPESGNQPNSYNCKSQGNTKAAWQSLILRTALLARICDTLPTGIESATRPQTTGGRTCQRPGTRARGSKPSGNASQMRAGGCVTAVISSQNYYDFQISIHQMRCDPSRFSTRLANQVPRLVNRSGESTSRAYAKLRTPEMTSARSRKTLQNRFFSNNTSPYTLGCIQN